jgi:uncharacterized membrane protein YdjX (TVP38/TMEM64 family)
MRSPRFWKLAAVFAALVLLATAQHWGLFRQFAEPARLSRTLVELGPWGYLAFIAAYAALQPFGLPGTVFVFAAPLIWPWPVAFSLSMAGTMAASVVGFSFTRFVARDAVARLVPVRFEKYDDALAARAFMTVFWLRLVFWMPPLLHAFFGLSKVRFWTHFWASFLGYVPTLLLVSYFGQKLFDALKDAPPRVWLALASPMLLLVVGVWLVRRHAARRAARAKTPATTGSAPAGLG